MSEAAPHGNPDAALEDPRGLVTYFVSAVLLAVALYLAIQAGASPLVVAGSVLAYLVLFGLWLLARRRRDAKTYAQWRDVMPCYLSVMDRNFQITEANEALRKDFGDWEGRRCYRLYKQRETPCPECTAREVMADGQVRCHKASVIRRDGSVAHIVSTTSPQRDVRGDIVGAVEMFTDITEMENLRLELEKTRRDYERFFDSLPSYASVIGRDLRIIEANALYRRDFGDAPRDFCYATCKGRTEPCTDCLVHKTFEDGEIRASEETLTTLDGRRVNVVVQSMPVFDDAGAIASVMEVFTDITEIKRLESKLSLMGRAVAGIAHRIKNIVMGLEGGIFVVNTGMKSKDQDQISDGWEMVESNVGRVSRIVKDLLYCAKERPPSKLAVVDPAAIVDQVRELYADRTSEFGIDLTCEVAGPLDPVLLDADGIHSLLCNLVANAMDACRFDERPDKAPARIVVRCLQEDSGDTVFEVEDSGPGIPEEFAGRVFQDFFSTKGTEGTGIGLLVVKTIAEEHGGEVTFRSAPGQGTTFRVSIPRPDESVVATGTADG